MPHSATRFHDISCGHRVDGHEGQCRFLHGHNYRVHFTVETDFGGDRTKELDGVGRVVDFSVLKTKLCQWLEDKWDHRFLIWKLDRAAEVLPLIDDRIVLLPFNPTAENMAAYLANVVGPEQLKGTGARLVKVTIEETAKCSATYEVTR